MQEESNPDNLLVSVQLPGILNTAGTIKNRITLLQRHVTWGEEVKQIFQRSCGSSDNRSFEESLSPKESDNSSSSISSISSGVADFIDETASSTSSCNTTTLTDTSSTQRLDSTSRSGSVTSSNIQSETHHIQTDAKRYNKRGRQGVDARIIKVNFRSRRKYQSKQKRTSRNSLQHFSLARKCRLIFPPNRIGRKFKLYHECKTKAKIFATAVLERLTFDLLEIAVEKAKGCSRKQIRPVHITKAVVNDEEFCQLFRNVAIPIDVPKT